MVLADDPTDKQDEPENGENTTSAEESAETPKEKAEEENAEPSAEEVKDEAPAEEEKAEEPVAEEKAEEPAEEEKAEEPAEEEKAEEPVAEEKAEEPVADEKAEEAVAEKKEVFDVSLADGHVQISIGGETHPDFATGDTITVHYKIKEGNKERIQQFKGVVLQRKGFGTTETVTIRKVSGGIGVERIMPLASPYIEKIEVHKRGKVRRARIFYLRDRKGKSARIGEKKS
jgi:large subunit ribosomal protein L19